VEDALEVALSRPHAPPIISLSAVRRSGASRPEVGSSSS